MYQAMYAEKALPTLASSNTSESVYISFEVAVRSTKSAALKNEPLHQTFIGAPHDRGIEIGTILNKLAFLLGTPAVSGIKD